VRKIVLLRPHEWLRDSFANQAFAIARPHLTGMEWPGVRFVDEPPAPVPIAAATGDMVRVPGGFSTSLGHNFMLVADVDDEAAADQLVQDPNVEGVFSDPQIELCPVVCPSAAVGGIPDVSAHVAIAPLHAAGHRGQGVRVAIVDNGIDGAFINVSGGLNLPGFPAPGTSVRHHGSMVAFDVQIAAPNAMVLDYPLLRTTAGGGTIGFLSDAIRIYADLMVQILQVPGPMVVVNSWAIYDRSQDRPVGHPQNYTANPKHPFNQILTGLVGAGADVVFAAGNCGSTCPDGRCGAGDRGPGKSIHGANSHPDAITVAALTHTGDLLGYSSEGPGGLHAQKPDISGTSHFFGSGVFPADSGTSAACPVVAGVVAALRSKPSARSISPVAMKTALLQSAVQPAGTSPGWNPQTGFGVINAAAAHALV
jgi:subtilisin family serine protease